MENYRKILYFIFTSNQAVTGEKLANIINVSLKTLRKNIKEINQILLDKGVQIKSKTGVGYYIEINDDSLFEPFKNELVNDYMAKRLYADSQRNRANYIVRSLLSDDKKKTLFDLSEAIYYSDSSINKDMKIVKGILKKSKLKLSYNNRDGYAVKGNETNIRYCLIYGYKIYYLNNALEKNPEQSFENLFDLSLKDQLFELIDTIMFENQYHFSKKHYIDLVLWILLSISRRKKTPLINYTNKDIKLVIKHPSYKITNQIYYEVEKKFK